MLENQEGNWEVHTLKKREERNRSGKTNTGGSLGNSYLSIYSILGSTYQSVIFSHINLQKR